MNSRIAVVLVALLSTTSLGAQNPASPRLTGGIVSGRVVDAETGSPLGRATVVLEPRDAGAFPAGSGLIPATRTTRTDSTGEYRFGGVPPGDYRLHAQRLGYRSATVGVQFRGASDSRVSVGLSVEPLALERIEVSAVPGPHVTAQTYARAATLREEGDQRVLAERIRQRRYLPSDVRAITHADVVEGISLGETDLFRSLQRLPGVSTRDDYTAELWTRSAPWNQTRISFDGLPLFNPLHALGLLSGVNPDAIGAAFFHSGVQPTSASGGAAGLLDLRSRRGGGREGLNGFGEISIASARLALDQEVQDGRGAWMVAARRTYLDWLSAGIEKLFDEAGAAVPYVVSDVAGRVDYQLDPERTLEVSGLWETDRLSQEISDGPLEGNSASWGNAAGRITLEAPLWRGRARHTVGISRYGLQLGVLSDSAGSYGTYAPTDNAVLFTFLGGEWTRANGGRPGPWSIGYELAAHAASYQGPGLDPFPGNAAPDTLAMDGTLVVGTVWGERRFRPWQPITVDAGVRLEFGESVRNAGPARIAPRINTRYQAAPGVSVSASLGRTYQYTQTFGATQPLSWDAGVIIPTWDLWLTAGQDVPAIRADVATFGVESWLGSSWLAAINSYVRHQSGLTVPDPTPGALVDRPLFVEATTLARGAEFSARKLAGRWTGSASYSYGTSKQIAAGLRYPAPTERRHVVDAAAMLHLARSLRIGTAYTGASGAPYARTRSGVGRCNRDGQCVWEVPPRVEEPGAHRTPAYSSLDLLVDWNRAFRSWQIGAYLQVRNVLNHDNPALYSGYHEYNCPQGRVCNPPGFDQFAPGPPRLPLIGFRIAF